MTAERSYIWIDEDDCKMPAPIRKITVTEATFKGEVIEPTFINFFYGRNRAGKLTIAKTIRKDNGVKWEPGKNARNWRRP